MVSVSEHYDILQLGGKFVLSIDKNQNSQIDTGFSKITVYPDNPNNISFLFEKAGFNKIERKEVELAYIISGIK